MEKNIYCSASAQLHVIILLYFWLDHKDKLWKLQHPHSEVSVMETHCSCAKRQHCRTKVPSTFQAPIAEIHLTAYKTFIHLLIPFYHFPGHGAARAYPGYSWAKAGDIIDRSPICRRAYKINKRWLVQAICPCLLASGWTHGGSSFMPDTLQRMIKLFAPVHVSLESTEVPQPQNFRSQRSHHYNWVSWSLSFLCYFWID